jgi:hypothetical protein
VTDLSRLTVEDFAARVGEPFRLADGTVYELVEAVGTGAAGAAPRAPFSLVFAAPPDSVRPQGIEALTNEHLGTLEVFLVPIGRDGTAVRYQAIFT